MRVKRSRFLLFQLDDRKQVDLGRLLKGEIVLDERVQLCVQPLAGEGAWIDVTLDELSLTCRLPTDAWIHTADLPESKLPLLQGLIDKGIVLNDTDDQTARAHRAREQVLRDQQWHPLAASYHRTTRDVGTTNRLEKRDFDEITAGSTERFETFLDLNGPPPPAFYEMANTEARVELPRTAVPGSLEDVLARRTTRRGFADDRAMALPDVAGVLEHVLGCQGTTDLADGLTVLRRASPSGGSLHPIEGFVLARSVEGVPSGLYHYNSAHHALDRLQRRSPEEVADLALDIAGGQPYARDAHLSLILVARILRNAWKYRRNARTYSVLLLDAGHLGQTFALVATALGLANVFSAAIDAPRTEEALDIDWARLAPLALCCCGPQGEGDGDHRLDRRPHNARVR